MLFPQRTDERRSRVQVGGWGSSHTQDAALEGRGSRYLLGTALKI